MAFSTLTPEMSAFLDKYEAEQARAKRGEAPPVEVSKDLSSLGMHETKPVAVDLVGAFDYVEHASEVSDGLPFAAPRYVTRTPIRYDELCRLLYRLNASGENIETLARAIGIAEDDVTQGIAAWRRFLKRSKSPRPKS